MPLRDILNCLSGDIWADLETQNDFCRSARFFQGCSLLCAEALEVISAQGGAFSHIFFFSGQEGAETVDTGLIWGMQERGMMERLPILIKDNKQSDEELSFSFSLRQKPVTSPQKLVRVGQ